MTYHKTRGFTLTELLIVMAILGMLLAIVAPTTTRMLALARRAQCMSQLHNIGKAYTSFYAQAPGEAELGALSWTETLWPHLGDHPNAGLCPEDANPHMGLPDLTLKVSYFGVGESHAENSRPLFSRFPYWDVGPCEHPGPGVWKLNEEDYAAFAALPGNEVATDYLPKYKPGNNPNAYYIVIEEGLQGDTASSDFDYDDLIIHVTQLDNRKVEMTFAKQWHWANYELWDADGNQIGNSEESLGVGQNTGPFSFDAINNLSYGINYRITNIPRGLHRVVALDYTREVAHVGGELEHSDDWEQSIAPRHLGLMNVLFADGTVIPTSPDDIDPGEPNSPNDLEYWSPTP